MTRNSFVVRRLLALYPAAWRRQYGLELAHVLLSRPLSVSIVGDVVWSAFRERLRSAEPAWLLGLLGMAGLTIALAVTSFLGPLTVFGYQIAVLRPSRMTLPTVEIVPLATGWYLTVAAACGFWTVRRSRKGSRTASAGGAAFKMTLVAGLPIALLGALALAGADPTPVTHVSTTELTRSYLDGAVGVLLSPLFAAIQAYLYGFFGGLLGRAVPAERHAISPR